MTQTIEIFNHTDHRHIVILIGPLEECVYFCKTCDKKLPTPQDLTYCTFHNVIISKAEYMEHKYCSPYLKDESYFNKQEEEAGL